MHITRSYLSFDKYDKNEYPPQPTPPSSVEKSTDRILENFEVFSTQPKQKSKK
jgi:hypothetical protein